MVCWTHIHNCIKKNIFWILCVVCQWYFFCLKIFNFAWWDCCCVCCVCFVKKFWGRGGSLSLCVCVGFPAPQIVFFLWPKHISLLTNTKTQKKKCKKVKNKKTKNLKKKPAPLQSKRIHPSLNLAITDIRFRSLIFIFFFFCTTHTHTHAHTQWHTQRHPNQRTAKQKLHTHTQHSVNTQHPWTRTYKKGKVWKKTNKKMIKKNINSKEKKKRKMRNFFFVSVCYFLFFLQILKKEFEQKKKNNQEKNVFAENSKKWALSSSLRDTQQQQGIHVVPRNTRINTWYLSVTSSSPR